MCPLNHSIAERIESRSRIRQWQWPLKLPWLLGRLQAIEISLRLEPCEYEVRRALGQRRHLTQWGLRRSDCNSASAGSFDAKTLSVTRVGTPSFKSVPGVFPDSFESLEISMTSSANCKNNSNFLAKSSDCLQNFCTCSRNHGSISSTRGNKRSCFIRDHLQVMLEWILAFQWSLRLHNLANNESFKCLSLKPHSLWSEFGKGGQNT